MKALVLTNEEQAFELLDEYAGWYGDNGGDPDGNTWIPDASNDIPDSLAQSVVEAGYGYLANVEEATDEQIAAMFGVTLPEEYDDESWEEIINSLKEKANERLQWAHYGAYKVIDSQWVYIKKEA